MFSCPFTSIYSSRNPIIFFTASLSPAHTYPHGHTHTHTYTHTHTHTHTHTMRFLPSNLSLLRSSSHCLLYIPDCSSARDFGLIDWWLGSFPPTHHSLLFNDKSSLSRSLSLSLSISFFFKVNSKLNPLTYSTSLTQNNTSNLLMFSVRPLHFV